MGFVNEKQRAACYAQQRSAEKRGEKPKWNCKEFEKRPCLYGIKKDGFCKKKPKSKSIRRSPTKKSRAPPKKSVRKSPKKSVRKSPKKSRRKSPKKKSPRKHRKDVL
jgi:hypothetical protein